MRRRDFLGALGSLPALSPLTGISETKESTNVVVNMRYQWRMNHGSLRVLEHGDVAKDIQIQSRELWRMSADYYASKFNTSIPNIESFELYKFILHEGKFWSLGYQKPGYTLHLIDSTEGPFRSILYDTTKRDNVVVAESNRFGVVVKDTRKILRQEFSSV